jgi:hypothetical protein
VEEEEWTIVSVETEETVIAGIGEDRGVDRDLEARSMRGEEEGGTSAEYFGGEIDFLWNTTVVLMNNMPSFEFERFLFIKPQLTLISYVGPELVTHSI